MRDYRPQGERHERACSSANRPTLANSGRAQVSSRAIVSSATLRVGHDAARHYERFALGQSLGPVDFDQSPLLSRGRVVKDGEGSSYQVFVDIGLAAY